MSSVIGKIVSTDGKFFVKSVDGSLREVTEGDSINMGETLVGDSSNTDIQHAVVHMNENYEDIVILGDQTQLFDASLFSEAFDKNQVVTTSASVENAIVDILGDDIEDIDTAAGEESDVASEEGGEANFAEFSNASTNIVANLLDTSFDSTGQNGTSAYNVGEDIRRIENVTPTIIIQDEVAVEEDNSITIPFNEDYLDTTNSIVATAEFGIIIINNDGTLTYTPDADYNGEDSITINIVDDSGTLVTQTINVIVNDVNDAPTLEVESTKTVDEDGNTTVTFTAADSDGTIVSTTASAEHGTVVVNDNGTISYTPDADYNGADTITVTTTDDDGATATQTSSITVNDVEENNIPTSVDETQNVEFELVSDSSSGTTTNLVITLDISGSMDEVVEDGQTRLDIAKDALSNMIDSYSNNGDVNVKVITFSTDGESSTWLSAGAAKDLINSLDTEGATNYEDAVYETYNDYSEPEADSTVAYFISDGEPTVENFGDTDSVWYFDRESGYLDQDYQDGWNDFVDNYVDDLHVIALGDGITDTSYLDILAGAGNVETEVVTDATDLVNVITPEIQSTSIEGNALDNVSGGDGDISIDSIVIDGTTYTQDNLPTDGVEFSSGAVLNFDFQTGDYTFTTNDGNYNSDTQESFSVNASDEDGDVTSFDVDINININTDNNIDDTASAPTLTMDIDDVRVVESDRDEHDDDHDDESETEVPTLGDNTEYSTIDGDNDIYGTTWEHDEVIEGTDSNDDIIMNTGDRKEVDAGDGDDYIQTGFYSRDAEIDAGDGDDYVDVIYNKNDRMDIDLGDGNDVVNFENTLYQRDHTIDGGDGTDTIIINGNADDYQIVDNGDGTYSIDSVESNRWSSRADGDFRIDVKDVEFVQFNDKTFKVTEDGVVEFDGTVSSSEEVETQTSYEYDINLNAGLTDTDGSETLSSITVDNLPNGTTIDGLTPNDDGSYTIEVDENGEASVTLVSDTELSNTELNSIEAEVTSTEIDSGTTHTTMTSTDLDESSDIGNDTYDISDDNTIDAGDGNDVFELDADDLATGDDSSFLVFSNGGSLDLDGGDGLDTLAVDGDMSIDLSILDDNISNIETIDLGDGSQNITSLSVDDVLEITDDNNMFRIDGDASDHIDLNTQGDDAEWTLGDFKTDSETGVTYQEVTGEVNGQDVTLEISTDIHIDES